VVLVDTSVWIRFLAGRTPEAPALDRLLADEDVAGHDLVHGELLIGDTGGRRRLLDAYARITRARAVPHDEVIAFVRARKLHGRGVGWVDAHLLASALVEGWPLWTADAPLAALASELGVAWAATR
jgi:predicted nucleic acid-binding protein